MRLIDADAMLETLKRKYPQWYTGKPKDNWMHYVCLVYYWAVREAPTIDAMPVVRCKDCKHCEYASNRIPTEQAWVCYKLGIDVEQDWFCADGERKDDEIDRR